MSAKFTIAGVAASALLASGAFAQTPPASPAPSSGSEVHAAEIPAASQADWTTTKLVGLAVYNSNDESLGAIDDLLTDRNGNIKAVVIGVGGLLGVGTHLVAVPFDKVKFVTERISYTAASGSPNAEGNRPASTVTTGAHTAPAEAPRPAPGDPDHAVFNATKDELKAMPEFKYST